MYDLKNLFGDKWVPAIMVALRDGPLRRVEILSTVNSYSIDENWSDKHAVLHDSILARTLKKMREQGIILRESHTETFPPEVTYSLNPEVVEVLTLAEPLIAWTEKHPELLAQAQAHSRQNNGDAGDLGDVTELDGAGDAVPSVDHRPDRADGPAG
ncbi:winged helix-turn-helix transcriptional regulator [Saccharothrix deserti]|uniref:winged helix-turn-helix transcriptional regulator n=1 Tax=Saccharothrix deserti TaxID=2593674 RepID=UPI00131E78DD|nr:winged helix-turn-helix transcriptional regulator [Saccharothrix deserti]